MSTAREGTSDRSIGAKRTSSKALNAQFNGYPSVELKRAYEVKA